MMMAMFVESFTCSRSDMVWMSDRCGATPLVLPVVLWVYCCCLHFIRGETKIQRGGVTFLGFIAGKCLTSLSDSSYIRVKA